MTYKISSYRVVSDVLPGSLSDLPVRLLLSTRTGKSLKIRDDIYQFLVQGRWDDISTDIMLMLFDLELVVPDDEDEFINILERNKEYVERLEYLDAVVQPTADCQLGCTYCGQVHRKQNLAVDVGTKITNRIIHNLENGSYKGLSVEWFGAEPLMAYSAILRMSDRLIAHCDEAAIDYSAHMITNGLSFKPAVFLKLIEKRCFNYQITLDGMAKTHDALRMTKKGQPTFDIIIANIIAVTNLPEFENHNCQIVVRMNVNKTSAPEVPELISYLASLGLHGKGVYLDFQPVVDWGDNSASDNSYSADEYAEQEINWLMMAIDHGFAVNNILPKRRMQPCMVVSNDAEAYDVSGNVYPCYEFPYTPAFAGEEYKLGHVDTIDAEYNGSAITRGWFDDVKSDVAPCKRCNLFPVCGGGCPKKWLHGERACPSFKDNIQDRLVLDYIQKSKKRIAASSQPEIPLEA